MEINFTGGCMLENDLLRFEQELGKIKQDLLNSSHAPFLEDEESYKMATKLDLAVARLMRILEYR
jgi:hypothetical protein